MSTSVIAYKEIYIYSTLDTMLTAITAKEKYTNQQSDERQINGHMGILTPFSCNEIVFSGFIFEQIFQITCQSRT